MSIIQHEPVCIKTVHRFKGESNLQNNSEFMSLLSKNGLYLQCCNLEMSDDKKIAFDAVKNNCRSYKFVGKNMRNNVELCILAITRGFTAEYYISSACKNNLDIARIALKYGISIKTFGKDVLSNRKTVLIAIKKDVCGVDEILKVVGNNLRNDPEIIRAVAYKKESIQV